MDKSTRRYIRKILGLNSVLLLALLAVVALGARQVYLSARLQAEEDTLNRQNLIARQTATGVENYFAGIIDNLNLLRRAEEEGLMILPQAGRPRGLGPMGNAADDGRAQVFALSGPMWLQLKDRTDGLVVSDTVNHTLLRTFPAELKDDPNFRKLIGEAEQSLVGIDGPRVTPPIPLDKSNDAYSLVAVPAGREGRYHLITLVRLAGLRYRFLKPISDDGAIGALLISEDGNILDAAQSRLKGMDFLESAQNPEVDRLFTQAREGGANFSSVVRDPIMLGGETLPGAMLTIHPMRVGDRTWFLALTRDIAGVDAVVKETFGGTVLWAAFVVIAAVAILLSTAITAIRGRGKLERLRAEMVNRELAMLDEELEQARKIQLKWLPDPEANLSGVQIAAVNTPASHISGDFYNWFELDDGRIVVVIGDVTGHGMAAAFLMATTQLLVRTTLPRVGDVGRCLREVNAQLCTQVYGGQFVTMLLCAIDPEAETIEIASAGHHSPLVCDDNGFRELEIDAQLVLGVDDDLDFPTTVHTLPRDCRSMILYTDGVIEAANAEGDRYDLDQFLADLPTEIDDPRTLADLAVEAVDRFAGSVQHEDDITLVALRLPEPTHPKAESQPHLATAGV